MEMWKKRRLVVAGVAISMLTGGAAWAVAEGGRSGAATPSTAAGAEGMALDSFLAGQPNGDATGAPGSRWGGPHPILEHLSNAVLTVQIEGTTHHVRIDHGIVQSVSAQSIVLKELDGETVTVPVDTSTKVYVNRRGASITDVEAGYVAFTAREAGQPARGVRAFDGSMAPPAPRPAQSAPGPTAAPTGQ